MENIKIKICDIRDSNMAKYCEEQGVNFLGIHQIKYPLTQEKKQLVKDIRNKTNGIKLVLVTQEEDLDKLLQMCKECEWDYIQLHFKISPDSIIRFKENLKNNFSSAGIISVIDISELEEYDVVELSKVSEFLLFDSSIRGGTGVPSKEEKLRKIPKIVGKNKFFIAGGLTDNNVSKVIDICKPFAVDVQSGVNFLDTKLKHQKDPKRIKDFVNAVNEYNKKINEHDELEI